MTARGWAVYAGLVALCIGIIAAFFIFGDRDGAAVEHAMPAEKGDRADAPASAAAPAAFSFEVMTTDAEHAKGLSGRESVPENYGMLFIFRTPGKYGFWMKDMQVPIDMIWLADDGTILGIEEAVSPDTYPTPFYPPQPVRYVLETKAWEAYRQGWDIGDRIPLPAPYGS